MALGIEGFTCFRRVTVPLAFRIALPPTANMLVDLFRPIRVTRPPYFS
jgi:ABC-type amino acid transport system permease subunit